MLPLGAGFAVFSTFSACEYPSAANAVRIASRAGVLIFILLIPFNADQPQRPKLSSSRCLFAALGRSFLFAIHVVAVGAGFGQRARRVDDFILILRLRCLVRSHPCLAQALYELGPIGILQ